MQFKDTTAVDLLVETADLQLTDEAKNYATVQREWVELYQMSTGWYVRAARTDWNGTISSRSTLMPESEARDWFNRMKVVIVTGDDEQECAVNDFYAEFGEES